MKANQMYISIILSVLSKLSYFKENGLNARCKRRNGKKKVFNMMMGKQPWRNGSTLIKPYPCFFLLCLISLTMKAVVVFRQIPR